MNHMMRYFMGDRKTLTVYVMPGVYNYVLTVVFNKRHS